MNITTEMHEHLYVLACRTQSRKQNCSNILFDKVEYFIKAVCLKTYAKSRAIFLPTYRTRRSVNCQIHVIIVISFSFYTRSYIRDPDSVSLVFLPRPTQFKNINQSRRSLFPETMLRWPRATSTTLCSSCASALRPRI